MDSKLNCKHHIAAKCKRIKLKLHELNFLLNRYSPLSLSNKILIFKVVIKPIWTYGLEIWGTTATSNIKPITTLQNKILRTITNANWYISNDNIYKDLQIEQVEEEMKKRSLSHISKIICHQNPEIRFLPYQESTSNRRLQRFRTTDLPSRFQHR